MTNERITNEQITALNETLADYIVEPSKLSEYDTRFEQFISKQTPQSIIDKARKIAQANDMHFNILDLTTFPDFILITTWRYDYRSIYAF